MFNFNDKMSRTSLFRELRMMVAEQPPHVELTPMELIELISLWCNGTGANKIIMAAHDLYRKPHMRNAFVIFAADQQERKGIRDEPV